MSSSLQNKISIHINEFLAEYHDLGCMLGQGSFGIVKKIQHK